MARQRREFSGEFTAEAVALVISTGHPVADVASDLGINEGTLGNWYCAIGRTILTRSRRSR